MSAIPWMPSTRVPIVQGSKLVPPLGYGSEDRHRPGETRHLNLDWSIARLDALRIWFRTSGLPADSIAQIYQSTPPEIECLATEMGEVIRVRRNQP